MPGEPPEGYELTREIIEALQVSKMDFYAEASELLKAFRERREEGFISHDEIWLPCGDFLKACLPGEGHRWQIRPYADVAGGAVHRSDLVTGAD